MFALSFSAARFEGDNALRLVVLLSSSLALLEEPAGRLFAVFVMVAGVATGDDAVADTGTGGLVGLGVARVWRVGHVAFDCLFCF